MKHVCNPWTGERPAMPLTILVFQSPPQSPPPLPFQQKARRSVFTFRANNCSPLPDDPSALLRVLRWQPFKHLHRSPEEGSQALHSLVCERLARGVWAKSWLRCSWRARLRWGLGCSFMPHLETTPLLRAKF